MKTKLVILLLLTFVSCGQKLPITGATTEAQKVFNFEAQPNSTSMTADGQWETL